MLAEVEVPGFWLPLFPHIFTEHSGPCPLTGPRCRWLPCWLRWRRRGWASTPGAWRSGGRRCAATCAASSSRWGVGVGWGRGQGPGQCARSSACRDLPSTFALVNALSHRHASMLQLHASCGMRPCPGSIKRRRQRQRGGPSTWPAPGRWLRCSTQPSPCRRQRLTESE